MNKTTISAVHRIFIGFGILLISSAALPAYTGYYEKYYDAYLNAELPGYLQRRAETLATLPTLMREDQPPLRKLILQKDLDYIATTENLRALWSVRQYGRWPREILLEVGKAALFHLRHRDPELESGFTEELGVLNQILKELRNQNDYASNKLLRDLIAEVLSFKRLSATERFLISKEEIYRSIQTEGEILEERQIERVKEAASELLREL